jgi:hypothetical protein
MEADLILHPILERAYPALEALVEVCCIIHFLTLCAYECFCRRNAQLR